ncbi:hypothetical protein L3X38_006200 [Prunus dulcis]|uniref:Integrase zinc-binding domain-containing protein n=1 Tax=Prunus dulcis TaxID=3755 RepID=A0AAD4ZSG2_PRUDU|nr:hypothetical protein L3X38_006200 [Prunus dulcis]
MARYYMKDNMLVHISYSGPYLTRIKYPQTLEVLCKIHYGESKNHAEGKLLAHKAFNAGYFWHIMRQDSMEYVQRCDRCQCYKLIS